MAAAPVGDLTAALGHAVRLLATDPSLAAAQAEEILGVAPSDPRPALILGMARRRLGDDGGARDILEPLARAQPGSAQTQAELGLALLGLGESEAALEALHRAVDLKPDLPDAWRAIGDLLAAMGDALGADRAYLEMIAASVAEPALVAAAEALGKDRLDEADSLLRRRLAAHPSDVAALRMLAESRTRLGRYGEAEELLETALRLCPSFDAARHNLALVLYRQQKAAEALPHLERLLAVEPKNIAWRNLLAACLGLVGGHEKSIAVYEAVLAEAPNQPKIWLSFGHALKTAGRRADAVAAYARCREMAPTLGEVYWSLANLKTVPFTAEEEASMRAQLARTDLTDEDALHFHYALGKALEDRGEYAESFQHYAEGARLRRDQLPYDADRGHAEMLRAKTLFTHAFFAERSSHGSASAAPIFVVGLPRSGSTLVEQILASHSAVEGTMELPDIIAIARDLRRDAGDRYPEALAGLTAEQTRALGEAYLERTAIHRKLGRAFFIDKMPNNFHHLGLIQLILPNARIIDARRGAMAACFSAFKQNFARGQAFSYDLTDLGRYYRDYVELMDHVDAVLPGRVHRVIYERMVEDTEGEVRRLLAYCGLDFEPACLRFYETDRAVRTASSEQVRRPIFREGLDQWRHFEPWLSPLKAVLGPDLAG